ncbi:hypothetical protein [Methylophaga sp.]|uniref:hypothetical protein n=1 Tax=Methylophaga sp. TaxID=2024840 RepID=UPI0027227640|nr:hypothetical protein [Methylophaga sp.]MDO8828354.1 hypothetical protein [Methylophaga sp.]
MSLLNQPFEDDGLNGLLVSYPSSRIFLFGKYPINEHFKEINEGKSVYKRFISMAFTIFKIKKSFTQGVVV